MSSQYITNHNFIVDSPVSGPTEFQIGIPTTKPGQGKNKIPFTIYVSPNGSLNHLGSYVYSIPDVYSTILQSSQESQIDLTKKMSHLIAKKYNSPCYANVNGDFEMEEFTPLISSVIKEIEDIYTC